MSSDFFLLHFFKMPWLILWDRDTQRFQCICFLLDIYCRTYNLLLKMVCFSSDIALEKTNFSLGIGHQLNIVSGLEREHVHTYPFSSSTPSPTDQCRPYASLWTHMCTSPVMLRRPWFLGSSIPSDSFSFSMSSSTEFPENRGKGFNGNIPFRAEYF